MFVSHGAQAVQWDPERTQRLISAYELLLLSATVDPTQPLQSPFRQCTMTVKVRFVFTVRLWQVSRDTSAADLRVLDASVRCQMELVDDAAYERRA